MACPYTFDDVLRAKKFHLSVLKDDFKKLVDFKADTNPKKWCGNKILYHYQFENLLNCKRDKKNYKSLQQMFENPDDLQKLWDDTIKRNRRKKGIDSILAIDIYEAYRINKGAIVFFKPSTAKYVYKLFNAKSVLDPTAGWGGRMLGAMSLGINYTGIDTNINLREGYVGMMSQFAPEGNVKMIWEDALKVDYSKLTYDLVLTSPPYVNMEIYEHCPLFNPKTFYKEWLIPLMDKVFEHLQEGGHMCFNISPKMFKDLMKAGYRPPDDKINLRQQMGQNYVVKSQDYIYVWNKSFKNLKTEILEPSNTNTMEHFKTTSETGFMDAHSAEVEYKKLYETYKKIQKENEKLKGEYEEMYDARCDAEEQYRELEEENKKVQKELDAVRQVNFMCMKFIKEIQTEQNLAEMIGLDKDTGTDIAIFHLIQENVKLREEKVALRKCKNDLRHQLGKTIQKVRQELTGLEKTTEK